MSFIYLRKIKETTENNNKKDELAQQLRALIALSEDLGSIPSTNKEAYNYL